VQLHKAKEDAPIGWVYSTNDWNDDYIYPDPYVPYALNLYNDWQHDYATKKRILILKKKPDETTLIPLQNERFMSYILHVFYNSLHSYNDIIYFEYWKDEDFFIDLYTSRWFYVSFYIQDEIVSEILSSSNPVISFLQYIIGKTLNIGIIGNETPKYSIIFDYNCKYYYSDNSDYIIFYVIKNPFFFLIQLIHDENPKFVGIVIYAKPRLIEDFNNYETNESNYEPDNDQSLRLNNIINSYFNTTNMAGLLYENVNINDDTEHFRYNLTRALLVNFKDEIVNNYYFSLDGEMGTPYLSKWYDYIPLNQKPLCIYFPLFRPQLDDNGFNMELPQYNPLIASTYMGNLSFNISLRTNGEVISSLLSMTYYSRASWFYCYDFQIQMLSWRSGSCDFTRPFRFVGYAGCNSPDEWVANAMEHNANYLFLIVKPSSSDTNVATYSIKGIGCGELSEPITSFSDKGFEAEYELTNTIDTYPGLKHVARVTFSARGYPIEDISNTLGGYGVRNNETCFVLFNESLIENTGDFLSMYQAVTAQLPNAIVCYIGSSETVPDTHKNKVIHSNAIVTDLDTNEQVPLVINYIRYAKKLYELFNR
jgi:hypothetical protein